jgi:hypothetical protein
MFSEEEKARRKEYYEDLRKKAELQRKINEYKEEEAEKVRIIREQEKIQKAKRKAEKKELEKKLKEKLKAEIEYKKHPTQKNYKKYMNILLTEQGYDNLPIE